MEYLALQACWLPAHTLALYPHTRPCPSFSLRHLTRRVGTIGRPRMKVREIIPRMKVLRRILGQEKGPRRNSFLGHVSQEQFLPGTVVVGLPAS